jgi:putative SOS response-associated peptidase YedK
MCGRYSMASSVELVGETFEAEEVERDAGLLPRWNVAPTQEAAVVRLADSGARRLDLLRWGLLAEGAATPAGGRINARSETVETLPAFRDAFARRRCLVPADGFYEWLRLEGRRHPFHLRRRDRRPFAFAGLWGRWQRRGQRVVDSFTILTCPPSELVRPLHDRMPVILPRDAWQAWLAPASDPADLRALLVPWQGDELEAAPVSPFVNRADHEGPECLREVPPPMARQLTLLPS